MAERGTVLLVDDDKGIRLTMSRILVMAGYRVLEANDGWEAVGLAEREHFDVALVDYKMTGMDGSVTCAALRQLNDDAALYIVTAHVDTQAERAARADGASDVIHKPVDVHRVLERIGQATRRDHGAPEPVCRGADQ